MLYGFMAIEQFTIGHPMWADYVAHMRRTHDARWVLDDSGYPLREGLHFFGVVEDKSVIGHISLQKQPVVIPPVEGNGTQPQAVKNAAGEILHELFVDTFSVEGAYRRKGNGTALQRAALRLAHDLGCYQMRSWSSLDKTANYALKLKLGFGIQPAVHLLPDGRKISGAYFVTSIPRAVF